MTAAGIIETAPSWLRPGNGHVSFVDILRSRVSLAIAFDRICQFIAPYWQVDPVLEGLQEMFQLFLPSNLFEPSYNLLTKVNLIPEVTHDQMIGIVEKIIQGLSNVQEPPLSFDLVLDRRSAWTRGIRLTDHAKVASYDLGKASDSLYAAFRLDASVSAHEDGELFFQSLTGPPCAMNKRRRGDAELESEDVEVGPSTGRQTRPRV